MLQNGAYELVHKYIDAYANIPQKISKDAVFSGLYFSVFALNTRKYGPEKYYAFGHFSCSKQRLSIKRVIVLLFRKSLSLHFPQLPTKKITTIVC